MNTLLKPTSFFTGKKLLYTALMGGIFAFASCSKKDNSPSAVSEDDATEIVTQAVVPNSGGLAVQLQGTVAVSTNTSYLAACGASKDTTVSGSGSIGSNITWDYNFNWHWVLTCGGGSIPSQFDLTFRGLVHYAGPIVQSADSSVATYSITGLSGSQFTVNTSYIRGGNKQLRDGSLSFYSLITLTGSNIVVDKNTQRIVSGTATVQIDGYDNLGKSFSYSGTLTFNGSNTGTLTFASGHTVNISW